MTSSMELASNEVLVVHVYSTSVTKEEGSVECQHAEISVIFRLKGRYGSQCQAYVTSVVNNSTWMMPLPYWYQDKQNEGKS